MSRPVTPEQPVRIRLTGVSRSPGKDRTAVNHTKRLKTMFYRQSNFVRKYLDEIFGAGTSNFLPGVAVDSIVVDDYVKKMDEIVTVRNQMQNYLDASNYRMITMHDFKYFKLYDEMIEFRKKNTAKWNVVYTYENIRPEHFCCKINHGSTVTILCPLHNEFSCGQRVHFLYGCPGCYTTKKWLIDDARNSNN